MINNKILEENGFKIHFEEIDEYNNYIIEQRWYYGPDIYLLKISDKEYALLKESGVRIAKVTEDCDIRDLVAHCKDIYSDINKQLTAEIEKLKNKQNIIANFIF